MIRKSGEELYSKTYQSPAAPQRIALKPNLHYERQDTTNSDARTSFDHSSKHKEDCDGGTYNESNRGEIRLQDPRIAPFGCPRARSHPREGGPKVDSSVRDASESRSVASRPEAKSRVQSIQRAVKGNNPQYGNMEYFEICDITSKIVHQLCDILDESNCVLFLRNMLTTLDQVGKQNSDSNDVLSTPNYVIKKGPSHGARHGNTERQRFHHTARLSSKKAKKKEYKSTLDRFLKSLRYRHSQIDIGWTKEHCARLDEIAAEDHSCVASAGECARRENTWVLVLNSSGPNGPVNQARRLPRSQKN